MKNEKKLPKLLVALLAGHGLCTLFLFVLSFIGLIDSIVRGQPLFLGFKWWLSPVKDIYNEGYIPELTSSIFELLGFLLAIVFIIFAILLLRRKKASPAPLFAVALLELGWIAAWVGYAWKMVFSADAWLRIAAMLLPFAAALVFICCCMKTLKEWLKAPTGEYHSPP